MINVIHTKTNNSQPEQRIERKFFIQPENIGMAYALLNHICKADCNYHDEQINSLYFDTFDLNEHERSMEGEFRKDKIRIRWYYSLDTYTDEVPIFIELKSREGFAGSKKRKRDYVSTHQLEEINLHNGIVPKRELINTLAGFNYYPDTQVYPIILISYHRYRFTELLTGTHVSLDSDIRSTMISRQLKNGQRELKVPGAVIEVKGSTMELPVMLRQMKLLDIDWSRFSKYSLCLDSHLVEPGDAAQLWPSGILFDN
jgi:hypothetical protein